MAREVAVPLEAQEVITPRKPAWRRIAKLVRQHPLGAMGVVIVIVLIICALFAEYVAPYDPQFIDPHALRMAPSLSHPFGTDRLGRDVMSRTIFGARISMFIGLVAVLVGTMIGTFFGLISGYFGGVLDVVIRLISDSLMTVPGIAVHDDGTIEIAFHGEEPNRLRTGEGAVFHSVGRYRITNVGRGQGRILGVRMHPST